MRCPAYSGALAAQCDLEEGHEGMHDSYGDGWGAPNVKHVPPTQIEIRVCEQCAVWRPREEVTFHGLDAAEDHCLQFHSHRFLDAYREVAEHARLELGRWPAVREMMLTKMLRNRNA